MVVGGSGRKIERPCDGKVAEYLEEDVVVRRYDLAGHDEMVVGSKKATP